MLTRADLLRIVPVFPREEVTCPEWGDVTIWIRVMTSADRDRLANEVTRTNQVNFSARLVLYTACNEAGEVIFQPQDLAWLGNQSSLLIARLAAVAMRLNGYSAAEIEDVEKNSASGQSDGSASAWPHSSAAPCENSANDSGPTNSPSGMHTNGSTTSPTPISRRRS